MVRVLFEGVGCDGTIMLSVGVRQVILSLLFSGRGMGLYRLEEGEKNRVGQTNGNLHNCSHHADIHHDPPKGNTDPVLAKVHGQAIGK